MNSATPMLIHALYRSSRAWDGFRRGGVLALITAFSVLLPPALLPADAPANIMFHRCPPYDASQGRAAGPYAVRVHRIPCRQGKRVARIAVRHGEEAVVAWTCRHRRKGPEGSVTTCRRQRQIVRFFSGA